MYPEHDGFLEFAAAPLSLEYEAFPDFSASDKWHPHPTYHIRPPSGWINDPCAPGFDVATGTHHLFYQWNPKGCNWENICWGHLTSKDGVRWTHNGTDPVLQPSEPYDKDGIFSGCLYPTGPKGEYGQLTLMYTSVCHLPIHWTTPHVRNSQGLALATSTDSGRTWQKNPLNPILVCEPLEDVVTGFRDPFLASWPAMDKVRGETCLYGIISGGIADKGPNAFVFAVEPHDLTKWNYIGPLVDIPRGFCPPGKWSCDYGVNWECTQFMTLKNDSDQERQFLVISACGGVNVMKNAVNQALFDGENVWMSGVLKRREDGVRMEYSFGGVLDHGVFYAANSYAKDPEAGTRIAWGWMKEEDVSTARCNAKGWIGYLSLPRELFFLTIPNVVRALRTPLEGMGSINLVHDISTGTHEVQTLGIRALPNLTLLRTREPEVWKDLKQKNTRGLVRLTHALHWELEAVIKVLPHHKHVGFHVRHNNDFSQRTSIFFSVDDESITLQRKCSNFEEDISKADLTGPFTLFTMKENGVETVEKLRLRIFGDGDTLEIFANDRFALSGTTYADTSMSTGISCYCEGGDYQSVVFESIKIWDGLSAYSK